MLKFIALETRIKDTKCSVANEGCMYETQEICCECMSPVCENEKCRIKIPIDYLEGKPEAVYCPNCKPST